jgi:hypothetical protein
LVFSVYGLDFRSFYISFTIYEWILEEKVEERIFCPYIERKNEPSIERTKNIIWRLGFNRIFIISSFHRHHFLIYSIKIFFNTTNDRKKEETFQNIVIYCV